MPEFMMILCDVEAEKAALPSEELLAHYARISKWWEEHERAGRIVAGAGRRLHGAARAKTVRVRRGEKAKITDGPFAETKEVIGGFGILNVADMQEALELVSSFPGYAETIEVRPVMTFPERD